MAITNKERVGRALDTLREGLYPFVEREMRSVYRDKWVLAATSSIPDNYSTKKKVVEILKEDISALLILMCDKWQDVF